MAEKVVTRKSFIGGRLVYPGEVVDVDEKGAVVTAASTPIGQMSPEQIEAYLKNLNRPKEKPAPKFGENVADPDEENTGTQRLEMAPFRPAARGARPQGLPPGTEEHNNTFIRPAPEEAPAAVEEVVGSGTSAATSGGEAFDHDNDGKVGGSTGGEEKALSRQTKAELLATARKHGVEASESDTNAEIVEKIEKARNAS